MPSSETVTVLLADDDALRRDGLAAVLESAGGVKIVSRCQDGNEALEEIRDHRPSVAVVDMNLPQVHGIELVRRVRSEGAGTRVIIMSGSADDDIVREAVRAGADGYLLKNGPARHLVDAIRYVCDGGQYFSPQLGRDGRDRHLLEEPPRPAPARPAEPPTEREDMREQSRPAPRRQPRHMQDRLRDEAGDLDDRDYKIMAMMAETMKPMLDRLEEIDNRVADMEEGGEELPEDPRAWLSSQLADTFRGGRGDSRSSGRGGGRDPRDNRDLEARLPQLIEQAVTERFQNMAGKLQQEIEETHVKTLETFVKNVQVKLVQRVSSLEQDMARHTQAMQQLRDSSQRTEDNLNRLITGVDRLAQDLPKRIAAATAAGAAAQDAEYEDEEVKPRPRKAKPPRARVQQPQPEEPEFDQDGLPKQESTFNVKKLIALIVWGIIALALTALIVKIAMKYAAEVVQFDFFNKSSATVAAAAPASGGTPAAPAAPKVKVSAGADTKTKLDAANQAADGKDYATAEQILKSILDAEPNNTDALKALASVLYRQDKIAESAAILDRIK